jgi:hypothetical protein
VTRKSRNVTSSGTGMPAARLASAGVNPRDDNEAISNSIMMSSDPSFPATPEPWLWPSANELLAQKARSNHEGKRRMRAGTATRVLNYGRVKAAVQAAADRGVSTIVFIGHLL